jgi:hypothetical protein
MPGLRRRFQANTELPRAHSRPVQFARYGACAAGASSPRRIVGLKLRYADHTLQWGADRLTSHTGQTYVSDSKMALPMALPSDH